jgi:hypothetical protein
MDAFTLSHKLIDAWREAIITSEDSGSINKKYADIPAYVIIGDSGKRRVIGCRLEGSDIILDVEGK